MENVSPAGMERLANHADPRTTIRYMTDKDEQAEVHREQPRKGEKTTAT